MTPPLLELCGLSVGYRQKRKPDLIISSGISLNVEAGEFLCLLGPNGAGKSTLLRTLAGEQQPLAGSVRLQGYDLHALTKADLATQVSIVLTERVTSSLLTVFDLVAMGRIPHTGWSGKLSAGDHKIVEDSLASVKATVFIDKRLSELSDGERQRCMLARALAQQPKLLILDEITAFLDLPRRIEMMHLLQQLAHEQKVAVVLSTHDLDLALASADRILLQPKSQSLLDAGPEDLVLSGAFEEAFNCEGLIFDKASGNFSLARARRGTVSLIAEGVEAYWAQRALDRFGFAVQAVQAHGVPSLHARDGSWHLLIGGTWALHSTLASAMKALAETATLSRGRHTIGPPR